MTALFLYLLSYLHLMVKATIPSILNTVRNISIRLYGSVEEVVTMCLVQNTGVVGWCDGAG